MDKIPLSSSIDVSSIFLSFSSEKISSFVFVLFILKSSTISSQIKKEKYISDYQNRFYKFEENSYRVRYK